MQETTKWKIILFFSLIVSIAPLTYSLIFVGNNLNSINTVSIVDSVDLLNEKFAKLDTLNLKLSILNERIQNLTTSVYNFQLNDVKNLILFMNATFGNINKQIPDIPSDSNKY
jgi:hypothetical protein